MYQHYAPVFLEKSPHHLCQWSALELINDCTRQLTDVDTPLIGLVRNPMDAIYSQYRRWKSRPEGVQQQWLIGYRNLERLRQTAAAPLVIVRYEDMVSSLDSLQPIVDFCGCASRDLDPHHFHSNSVSKWRRDLLFGFAPSDELVELAERYGYHRDELSNEQSRAWPVIRELSRARHKAVAPLKTLAKHALGKA